MQPREDNGPEITGPHWAASLYRERAADLLLYGRALGLGHAEAEDVLHDAFRAVLDLEPPPRQPRAYLVRAFRNRALNYRRGLVRRLFRELESAKWFDSGPTESPFEQAAVAGLKELPPDQREVIVLKVWHEMTFDGIGELLGISPNTAAGRYRYGVEKLRFRLKELSHEPTRRDGVHAAWTETSETLRESGEANLRASAC